MKQTIEELNERAVKLVQSRSMDDLLMMYAMLGDRRDEDAIRVRGWLLDEFERRNPGAFDAWLESDADDLELGRFMKMNPMCIKCDKLSNGCFGTINQVWTGCVEYKRRH